MNCLIVIGISCIQIYSIGYKIPNGFNLIIFCGKMYRLVFICIFSIKACPGLVKGFQGIKAAHYSCHMYGLHS